MDHFGSFFYRNLLLLGGGAKIGILASYFLKFRYILYFGRELNFLNYLYSIPNFDFVEKFESFKFLFFPVLKSYKVKVDAVHERFYFRGIVFFRLVS